MSKKVLKATNNAINLIVQLFSKGERGKGVKHILVVMGSNTVVI